MTRMVSLTVGDPVPWFRLPSTSNPNYNFDTVGGYQIILFFFGSTQIPQSAQAVRDFCAMQSELAAQEVPFFGVGIDPNDQFLADEITHPTYCKFLWDFEQTVSQQYGVCIPTSSKSASGTSTTSSKSTTSGTSALSTAKAKEFTYSPTTFVLDPTLRVLKVFPLEQSENYVAEILNYVRQFPPFPPPILAARQAPVLLIPRVLDPELCQTLVQLFETGKARDSGFMREVDGKTVEILDPGFKKRQDINLSETPWLEAINQAVIRRVKPEIEKVFQFSITRFERHIVARYDAANQGFFNRHRDNTTKGTAHRRFAMSLNLNTGDYEGGCLRFPEYGSQLYRPDTGEAVIFSCSLLHEATPVTQGHRFALLSFFYGDEDALVRERNRQYLANSPDANSSQAAQPPSSKPGFQPKSTKTKKRR